jgi:transketolase
MHTAEDQAAIKDLSRRAQRVRSNVLRMAHRGGTPHVASALSCVDLLVALYFRALHVDPADPDEPDRDRLILSKGHGCMALYAVLAERGFFPESLLNEYAQDGGRLAEHPGRRCVPGVELATGSLGHGLSVGVGLAMAARLSRRQSRVFVLMSDAECNEGSVWEAAMFAPAQRLDNLVAIVDYNKWSAMGRTEAMLEPFVQKWRAFGWLAGEIDGHDPEAIADVLASIPSEQGRPTVIIAHTVKGKGVSFMENNLEWHYRPPDEEDLEKALREIG